MLSPKRTKYRRHHRGRLQGKSYRGNRIAFGDVGLQALEPGWITSRQIEAGRRAITRRVKRGGKLRIRPLNLLQAPPAAARPAPALPNTTRPRPAARTCRMPVG